MQWIGFSLNQISLLALSLVAGVLVDDAIVEIENIVRHMRMGKSGFQAALDAADQIGLAVVATSATIIAVFLPVSFMGGIIGQYFKQFGLTVAAAVFFSLLVARLHHAGDRRLRAEVGRRSPRAASDGPIMAGTSGCCAGACATAGRRSSAALAFFALSIAGPDAHAQVLHPGLGRRQHRRCTSSCRRAYRWTTPEVADAAYRILASQPEVASVDESIGDDGSLQHRQSLHHPGASLDKRKREPAAVGGPRSSALLKSIPDARMHFQTRTAIRTAMTSRSTSPARTSRLLDRTARNDDGADAHPAGPDRCRHRRRPAAAGDPDPAALRSRGAARRHGGEHQRHDPHRHARRPGAERRQVLPARPPGADPRQPAASAAAGPRRTLENLPVPTASGGDGAAEGGGRHQLRRGADHASTATTRAGASPSTPT